jgi:hypothetical protein
MVVPPDVGHEVRGIVVHKFKELCLIGFCSDVHNPDAKAFRPLPD